MPLVFLEMIFINPVSRVTVRPISGLNDPGYACRKSDQIIKYIAIKEN